MNKEDFGAVKNLYENIINEAPLRDEPLWDGPQDRPSGGVRPTPARRPGRPFTTLTRPSATTPTRPTSPTTTTSAKPTSPATTSARPSSPANATTAQKIKGGLDVYKSQVKSGDVKGAEATGKSTWALANPTLANKPKTPNPLMQKTFGYQTGKAPDQDAKTTTDMNKVASNLSGTGALATKPSSSATTSTPKPAATLPTKRPSGPGTGAMTRGGASGDVGPNARTIRSSYEWGTKATLKDVASLYDSIYEAKKKVDQDKDGDNDFADVRIARMIASGVPKAQAIAAVKNKEYNEEYELDEATRMRKELGKEGETAIRKELAARSKAHQRSGSVDKTIAAAERGADRPYVKFKRDESDADRKSREEKQSKTLRGLASSRRKSVRSGEGLRGYAANVTGSDKDLQSARGSARSAGTLTPAEKKQMGEEYAIYEIVASYLLENNFAETIDDANVIIENMSETWISEILESSK